MKILAYVICKSLIFGMLFIACQFTAFMMFNIAALDAGQCAVAILGFILSWETGSFAGRVLTGINDRDL